MEPFEVLIDIAHRSHQAARDLPPRKGSASHWMGLGFWLLEQRFVVPMDEIAELTKMPRVTALPGVQNWLTGVANVRGRLMALIDLSVYFGQASNRARSQRRIYVLEGEDYYYGFIVDESLGMQHFSMEIHSEEVEDVAEVFNPFLRGSYNAATIQWPVLSLLA